VGSDVTLNGAVYVVERLISAATGEADIYLLRQGDQPAVLKLYYPNYQPKADVLAPLKQLRHDDILNLIDYGQFQGRFFEVMEYAAGGTVEEHLPVRDPHKLRALVAECVNALRFCHDRGIVHKDIKPGNLFYKKAGQTDLAIGDFGISSMLAEGVSRHLTSQSLTVGYAAPEMYGIDGRVYVGREVDYYALGVSLLHLWVGRSPFEGLGMHAIANLTVTGAIAIPADLPKDLQTLVRGLITIDFTHRWGFAEVQRWLKGEDVPVHVQTAAPAFPPFKFGVRDEAATPEALAVLLKAQLEVGKKALYSGKVSAWVNVFDQARASALDTIIEDEYPQAQDAGLQKAIYILDPDQPYESDKRQCRTTQELAAALEDGFSFYGPLLKNPHHAFYLYLEAHGAKKEADTFRQYFQTFSAKKALNATILALAGTASIRISGREFFSPEEVLAARGQAAVVDLIKDPESRLSLWMEGLASQAVRTRLEAWRALEICNATTLAYVSENAGGVPTLDVNPSRVSLSDLRPRSTSGGSFEVRNLGDGQLTGSISADQPWLTLATATLDPSQKTQTVAFTVDTSGFPFGATASATIQVQTNIGTATVAVDLAMEQGATAVARFQRQATAAGAGVGAIVGLLVFAASTALGSAPPSTLAGLLGVAGLGWCVSRAYKNDNNMKRNALAAMGGTLLVSEILRARAPALSSGFDWALLFGSSIFPASPLVLRSLQRGIDRKLVFGAVATCATALCAITIFIERQMRETIPQQVNIAGVIPGGTAQPLTEAVQFSCDANSRGAERVACRFVGDWEYLGDSWHCCLSVVPVQWPALFRVSYGDGWNGDGVGLLVQLVGNELRAKDPVPGTNVANGAAILRIGSDGKVTAQGSPLRRQHSGPSELAPPIVSGTPPEPSEDRTSSLLATAENYFERREYQQALEATEVALRDSPGNSEALALQQKITKTMEILGLKK